MFSYVSPFFDKDHMNFSFHGDQIGEIVAILLQKNILLTFQMEENGTFNETF